MQVIQDSLTGLKLGAPQVHRNHAFFPLLGRETRPDAALGEGEDIRLSGEGVAGGALAAHGRVVHLAGFAVAS